MRKAVVFTFLISSLLAGSSSVIVKPYDIIKDLRKLDSLVENAE